MRPMFILRVGFAYRNRSAALPTDSHKGCPYGLCIQSVISPMQIVPWKILRYAQNDRFTLTVGACIARPLKSDEILQCEQILRILHPFVCPADISPDGETSFLPTKLQKARAHSFFSVRSCCLFHKYNRFGFGL